jgi:hypothetical protein
MRKMRLFLIWLGCAVAALVATILAYGAVTAPRRDLDRFLREVATVEIGKTKLEDWRQQLAQTQLSSLMFTCEQETCGVGLRRENKLLQKLRVAPRTIVDGSVGFKNGVASEIYVALVVGRRDERGEWRDDRGAVVRLSTDQPGACHSKYQLLLKNRYGVGDRYWATMAMDSCVSPENRAKALAINGVCLTRIGGCKEVEAIIPQVFN